MMLRILFPCLIATFLFCHLSALEDEACPLGSYLDNQLLIGAQFYNVSRNRQGGTKQCGWLKGIQLAYRHMPRCQLYWGVEGGYGRGDLHGKNSTKKPLHSTMRVKFAEGQIGFSLRGKSNRLPAIIPYIGGGFFNESNRVNGSKALPLCFETHYSYLLAGSIIGLCPTDHWSISCHAKVRYMIDPQCKVSNDPDFKSTRLKVGNERLNWRIELPINYFFPHCYGLGVMLIPFYEVRTYCKRSSFPFDFLHTRLRDAGVTFALTYYFSPPSRLALPTSGF